MSTYNTQSASLSRQFAMSRFAEPHLAAAPQPTGPSSPLMIGHMDSGLDGSRALAGMLLAAVMAALLVVADQLIDTWADGHLLAAWVVLWTVTFAALALLAPPLRKLAASLAGGLVRYFAGMRAAQDEARMWELASHDPRVMEEIHAAIARHIDATS